MKKLKLFISILILAIGGFVFLYNQSHAETCGGKCTGSSSCTACKNCSGCAHCNSGGSCGVCSSSSETSNTSSISKNEVSTVKPVLTDSYKTLKVITQTINIRKSASTTAEVLCLLQKNTEVKLMQIYNEKWALVEVICSDGSSVIGYAYREFLTK